MEIELNADELKFLINCMGVMEHEFCERDPALEKKLFDALEKLGEAYP